MSIIYHVPFVGKINNFDYAEADLIALNAGKDDHLLYNGQLTKNEDEDKKYIISKLTVVSLWESYWNERFPDHQKCIPITIESKSSDIPNPYYMPGFFSYLGTLLLEVVLWSKLLHGN